VYQKSEAQQIVVKTISLDNYPVNIKSAKLTANETDSLLNSMLFLSFTEISGLSLSCDEFKKGVLDKAKTFGYDTVRIKNLSPKEAVLLSGKITSSIVKYQEDQGIKEVGNLCNFFKDEKNTSKDGNCQVFTALNKFIFDVLKDGNPNLKNTYMGYFSPSTTLNTIRVLTKNPNIPKCEGGGEHHIWNRVIIMSDTIYDSFVDATNFPYSYDALNKEHFGFLDKALSSGEFYEKEEILGACRDAEKLDEAHINKLKMVPCQIYDMERLGKLFPSTSDKKPILSTKIVEKPKLKDTTYQITYRLSVRNGNVTEEIIECGEGKTIPVPKIIIIHDTIYIDTLIIRDTIPIYIDTLIIHDTISVGNKNSNDINYVSIRDTISVFFGLGAKARLLMIIDGKVHCVEKHWIKKHKKEKPIVDPIVEEKSISDTTVLNKQDEISPLSLDTNNVPKAKRKIPLIVEIIAVPFVLIADGLYYVGYGFYFIGKKVINPFRDCPCDRQTGVPITKKMEKIKLKRWNKIFDTVQKKK
jgi:hypothetical protein